MLLTSLNQPPLLSPFIEKSMAEFIKFYYITRHSFVNFFHIRKLRLGDNSILRRYAGGWIIEKYIKRNFLKASEKWQGDWHDEDEKNIMVSKESCRKEEDESWKTVQCQFIKLFFGKCFSYLIPADYIKVQRMKMWAQHQT